MHVTRRQSHQELNQRLHPSLKRILNSSQLDDSATSADTLITDCLLSQGKITETQLARALEEATGTRYINPLLISFSANFLNHANHLVPYEFALEYGILPIKHELLEFHLIMQNPLDIDLVEELEVMTGSSIVKYCSTKENILKVLDRYPRKFDYDINDWQSVQDCAVRQAYTFEHGGKNNTYDLINHPSLVQLLKHLLSQSVASGISDIHFEPQEQSMRIRVRQDGVLRVGWELPPILKFALVNRLKLLSHVDLETTQIPQDGRITNHLISGRKVDMRVSCLPSIYGEKIVLRLLDKGKDRIQLADMRLEQTSLERINRSMNLPNGIILLTGPTGSGKTTTLYAILSELNQIGINISTAEDPVEYNLPGITQVDCSLENGTDFSQALKSFMRQDPDIIMVGEIRDFETADIATKAALTGHLVLSTLHTNDAPSAITRLVNIGVEPYMLAACNVTVIAQRLLRKVCQQCKVKTTLSEHEIRALNTTLPISADSTIYSAAGCEDCDQTGYHGRLAVTEVLVLDDEIEKAVLQGQGVSVIKSIAIKNGMQTLRDSAINYFLAGQVSYEEVLRVTID